MVLALTLTLVLVLTLALAPSGMISKKGVPDFCPSTVVVVVVVFLEGSAELGTPRGVFLEGSAQLGTPRGVFSKKIHQKSIKNPSKIH